MDDGINLLCPDGERRLCFPVLATDMADYEELRLMTSIVSQWCPKCMIPAHRPQKKGTAENNLEDNMEDSKEEIIKKLNARIAELEGRQNGGNVSKRKAPDPVAPSASKRSRNIRRSNQNNAASLTDAFTENNRFEDHPNHPPRTDFEAKRLRSEYDNEPILQKEYGYHNTKPFSERYPYSDVYDAAAPDLLHQVSKCFFDYLHQWILSHIASNLNVGIDRVKGEIDARFSQLPPYPRLRAFRKGLSTTTRWTGNEYKNMMKVYLGVIRDLLSPEMATLVKLYLDIHRLSHYVSHTDSTVALLASAIQQFTKLRNDRQGPVVGGGIKEANWYCPKIHLLQHYPDWIKWKGALPFSSTDRGEAWHRPLKASYRASNKGPQADEFILRDEDRKLGWKLWERSLSTDEVKSNNDDEEDDKDEDDTEEDGRGMQNEEREEIERECGEQSANRNTLKTVSLTKARRWRNERELQTVQEDLQLEGLVEKTMVMIRWIEEGRQTTVRLRRADVESRGVIGIRGHEALKVRYPEVHDTESMIQELVWSKPEYCYGQDKAWKKSRFDTVLLRYDCNDDSDHVSNLRVARVLLLFAIPDPSSEKELQFAYVQLFRTSRPADQCSGMFKVVKEERFEVIEVDTIERGVHLIPCFKGFESGMANGRTPPVLDTGREFWINNYTDLHIYNTVYE